MALVKEEEGNDNLNEEEREEMEQAVASKKAETAHLQTYNRFKDLQKEYSQPFDYKSKNMDISIKCSVSYLPFEGRIDRVTFELLLFQTGVKNLIMINSGSNKVKHVQQYCEMNKIGTLVFEAASKD